MDSNGSISIAYGEVLYYFTLTVSSETHSVALISRYSEPHSELLDWSLGTLWACHPLGDEGLEVAAVKDISDCIAMIPHAALPHIPGYTSTPVFMMEKLGGDMVHTDTVLSDPDGNES